MQEKELSTKAQSLKNFKVGNLDQIIIEVLTESEPMSTEELAGATGRRISSICGRITPMLKSGILVDAGTKISSGSRQKVRVVTLPGQYGSTPQTSLVDQISARLKAIGITWTCPPEKVNDSPYKAKMLAITDYLEKHLNNFDHHATKNGWTAQDRKDFIKSCQSYYKTKDCDPRWFPLIVNNN